MTDRPRPDRPQPARNALSTGDIAKLALCLLASTAAVAIGIALLWDVANPNKWTAAGWAAAGSWVAGIATVLAVGVALYESNRARSDAQREAAAADDRSRQALLAVQQDREIASLATLPYPVRSVSFQLRALIRLADGLNEHDALHSLHTPPAIPAASVDLLARLDEFTSDHMVKAIAVIDQALMVVKAPQAVKLLRDLNLELHNLGRTITEWRGIVGDGEGFDPSDGRSHIAVLEDCLATFPAAVEAAYPMVPHVPARFPIAGQDDATMTP
ncbi:hypothetical protein [Rhodococcus pyridinivorans]|uniref:hypothetical protein n=1 Tax=Rhodococcus pyridinivorans TaxID=103816 RepID=UPI00110E6F3B|nr:hypothetical protein [Rhodococcus pyridinivorans]